VITIDDSDFFVNQNYVDFLNRFPDSGGFSYWLSQITNCAGNQQCIFNKRIDVANAFFFEQEFQQTGSYVFRLYRASFGNTQPFPDTDNSQYPVEALKLPDYAHFKMDRQAVIGSSNLALDQQNLANSFAQKPEFITRYPASQSLDQFVTAILGTIKNDSGADLTSLQSQFVGLGSRGAVLYRLANDDLQGGNGGINNRAFIDAEYNRGFVYTQYAGFFRRQPDMGGFVYWLGQINSGPLRDVTKQHQLVCSQITADEYQFRFGNTSTHHNNECP
jgi:Domain of unknown function (DUF4214)